MAIATSKELVPTGVSVDTTVELRYKESVLVMTPSLCLHITVTSEPILLLITFGEYTL